MKTTVEIPDALFAETKELAAKEGLTFRILLEEGLRSVVEKRKAVQSKPFRLRDGSVPGGLLREGIKWSQLRELAYDDSSFPDVDPSTPHDGAKS